MGETLYVEVFHLFHVVFFIEIIKSYPEFTTFSW